MAISMDMIKVVREKSGAGMMDCKKALEECNGDIEKAFEWLKEKGIAKAVKKADRIAAEGLCNIKVQNNNAVILEVNSETDFASKSDAFKALVNEVTEAVFKGEPKNLEEALALDVNGVSLEQILMAATGKIGEKLTLRRLQFVTKKDNEVFGAYLHMGGKIGALVVLNTNLPEVAKDVAMHTAASAPQFVKRQDVPVDVLEKIRSEQLQAIKEDPKMVGKPEVMLNNILVGKVNKVLSEISLIDQPFVKDPDITVGAYLEASKAVVLSLVRYGVGDGIEKREENFAEEVAKQIKK